MLPILEVIQDASDWQMKQVTAAISDRFNLTDEERAEMLPAGYTRAIVNRVGWAKHYLKQAGLVLSPTRGVVRISPDGTAVLSQRPHHIDMKYLERFPAYVEFRAKKGTSSKEAIAAGGNDAVAEAESSETPEERIESAYQEMRAALADELLQQVKNGEDQFFERMVVELLVAMGYGGSFKDAGKAVGKSGDGGIDGVIKEDKLGLDVVVIQAKKWTENSVGRPAVQSFAGSMEGFRASKGVFITTSTFSQPAVEYVNTIQRRIVLIDGPALARLMIDHGIGVYQIRFIYAETSRC